MRPDKPSASRLLSCALLAGALLVVPACSAQTQEPHAGAERSGAASTSAAPSSGDQQGQTAAVGDRGPSSGPWSVDDATWDAASQAVAEMTVEQKAGQVIVATYNGADPESVDAHIQQIKDLHLGGVIVMGRNVPTSDGTGQTQEDTPLGGAQGVDVPAMTGYIKDFQSALTRSQAGHEWSGIVSVDQEGGTVTRLGSPLTQWPVTADIGAADDPQLTQEAAEGLASELAGLGFTMNNAPTADVTAPGDAVIRDRSYGTDSAHVSEQVVASVTGHHNAGVVSSVKHFPGHGSVTTDSHVGLPVQETAISELEKKDWAPFRAAVEAGVPTVMMGHIAVSAWNSEVPATLEPAAYQALRDDVGFHGVVVTDALDMGALAGIVGPGSPVDTGVSTPAGAALQAGADVLLMPEDTAAAHADIVQAVESGAIPRERLDQAVTRVVAMQMRYDHLHKDLPVAPSTPGSHQDVVARIDAAGE